VRLRLVTEEGTRRQHDTASSEAVAATVDSEAVSAPVQAVLPPVAALLLLSVVAPAPQAQVFDKESSRLRSRSTSTPARCRRSHSR